MSAIRVGAHTTRAYGIRFVKGNKCVTARPIVEMYLVFIIHIAFQHILKEKKSLALIVFSEYFMKSQETFWKTLDSMDSWKGNIRIVERHRTELGDLGSCPILSLMCSGSFFKSLL